MQATEEHEAESKSTDPLRRDLIERAKRFRSSWVEMAEGLLEVTRTRAYERWGYGDLYAYCAKELRIRKSTVDKLTGSYVTLERHAPDMLDKGAAPSCDAVDYFAKAMRRAGYGGDDGSRDRDIGRHLSPESNEAPEEAIEELRHAVFEEGQGVATLRRRFDPVFRPKHEDRERVEDLERASAAVARLTSLLSKLDGLSGTRRREMERALLALTAELDELLSTARKRLTN